MRKRWPKAWQKVLCWIESEKSWTIGYRDRSPAGSTTWHYENGMIGSTYRPPDFWVKLPTRPPAEIGSAVPPPVGPWGKVRFFEYAYYPPTDGEPIERALYVQLALTDLEQQGRLLSYLFSMSCTQLARCPDCERGEFQHLTSCQVRKQVYEIWKQVTDLRQREG